MSDNKTTRSDVKEGHNSGQLDTTTREKLRQVAAKIERLEEEKKEVADEIKAVYADAKAFGFDTKALRAAIRERKKDRAEREEHQMILDLYMDVLE